MEQTSPLTLVLVDDDEDEVFITERLVRRSGIANEFVSERKPECLFSTLSDLQQDRGIRPNVIVLLDINMPRQDGFEMLSLIRDSVNFKDVPVVMLSASDNDADIETASKLGADGYLVKPFRSEAFFEVLNRLPKVKHQLVLAA